MEAQQDVGNYTSDPLDLHEIRSFRDKEILADRWSPAFDTLLPANTVSPMFVVWRDDKPRVVTDHTGSGLNDGIPRHEAKVRYDDMHDFGQAIRSARLAYPNASFVLFKSDVAKAFLNLPAHPIWQLRQVVLVDGQYHIVRRLVFGNRASPRIWCAVSGLLCWLAVRRLQIADLHVYMDDFFGWDFADNLILFRGQRRPRRQVQLLILWEAIGCPFDDNKQVHGPLLKIIGFYVDMNNVSISLTPSAITDVIASIDKFLSSTLR